MENRATRGQWQGPERHRGHGPAQYRSQLEERRGLLLPACAIGGQPCHTQEDRQPEVLLSARTPRARESMPVNEVTAVGRCGCQGVDIASQTK